MRSSTKEKGSREIIYRKRNIKKQISDEFKAAFFFFFLELGKYLKFISMDNHSTFKIEFSSDVLLTSGFLLSMNFQKATIHWHRKLGKKSFNLSLRSICANRDIF